MMCNDNERKKFLELCEGFLQNTQKAIPFKRFDNSVAYKLVYENLKHSVCYGLHSEKGEWEIDAEVGSSVYLYVKSDRTFEIDSADHIGYTLVSAFIDSPNELSELFFFIRNVKDSNLSGVGKYIVKIKDIVDGVYITIPSSAGMKLWEINNHSYNNLSGMLKNRISCEFDGTDLDNVSIDFDDEIEKIENPIPDELIPSKEMQDRFIENCKLLLPEFDERKLSALNNSWLEIIDNDQNRKYFSKLKDPCERDIILSNLSFVTGKEEVNEKYFYRPKLVLRIKDKFSIMYFRDYLKYSVEGADALKDIASYENFFDIPNRLAISMPRKKVDQIMQSISMRHHMHNYKKTVGSLIQLPDPFDGIADRYKMRTENIRFVHSEFLYQIQEIKHPLPYIIERPYRVFRHAEDVEKVKQSMHLLNLLIKEPLFFILEELQEIDEVFAKKYIDMVYSRGKNLSDGAYLDLLRMLLKEIMDTGIYNRFLVFSDLIKEMDAEYLGILKLLVETRNRWGHPPNDYIRFVAKCDENFPAIIEKLRLGLEKLKILEVDYLRVDSAGLHVHAYCLDGHDRIFEKTVFLTNESHDRFPGNNLVVYESDVDKSVILSRFFSSSEVATSRISVNIYDRWSEPDGPQYISI